MQVTKTLSDGSVAQGAVLEIRGMACGRVAPAALSALHRLPEAMLRAFRFSDRAVTLALPQDNTAANAFLADVARALFAAGALPDWRNELLDILGDDFRPTGLMMERSAFRALGLVSQAIYAVATSPDGRLWLGLRSQKKRIDPGKFDTLASGLITAGETPLMALLRETEEEAGLRPPAVTFAPAPAIYFIDRAVPEGRLREITYAYRAKTAAGVKPRPADGEVAQFIAADTEKLARIKAAGLLTYETEAALGMLRYHSESSP